MDYVEMDFGVQPFRRPCGQFLPQNVVPVEIPRTPVGAPELVRKVYVDDVEMLRQDHVGGEKILDLLYESATAHNPNIMVDRGRERKSPASAGLRLI